MWTLFTDRDSIHKVGWYISSIGLRDIDLHVHVQEYYVLPVCLSGCINYNWILTDSLLKLLECFQADVGRRALWCQLHWYSSAWRFFYLLCQGHTKGWQTVTGHFDIAGLKRLEALKEVSWCKVWDVVMNSGPKRQPSMHSASSHFPCQHVQSNHFLYVYLFIIAVWTIEPLN